MRFNAIGITTQMLCCMLVPCCRHHSLSFWLAVAYLHLLLVIAAIDEGRTKLFGHEP
jgi:hypothetical protein